MLTNFFNLISPFVPKIRLLFYTSLPTLQIYYAAIFLFLKLKSVLKGRHFDIIDDKSKLLKALQYVSEGAFQDFQNCREKYMNRGGEYFERDKD